MKAWLSKMLPNLLLYVFVGNTAISFLNEKSVYDTQQQILKCHDARRSVGRTLSDMRDIETGCRGFLITNKEKFLEPFNLGLERLPSDIAMMDENLKNSSQIDMLSEIKSTIKSKLDTTHNLIQAKREGDDAKVQVLIEDSKVEMDKIRILADKMKSIDENIMSEKIARLHYSHRWMVANLILNGLTSIGIALHFVKKRS